MKAIFKKELKSYFCSMTGYALVSFLIIFVGIYFMIYNMGYGYPYFSYTLSGVMLVLMVFVPVLTMRSFAEERKNRTDQLLLTSPVKIRDIVAGKYLAMVTVFCVPNAVFCLFPLIIRMQGNANLLSDYIAILEFVILGCTFIAAGMFFSSITESPMIAAVSTFAVTQVLYIWDTLMGYLPDSAGGNLAVIIPEITDSSGLTGRLSSGTVLMNNCRAFGLGESSDDITVNAIMETSENGYLVSGSS